MVELFWKDKAFWSKVLFDGKCWLWTGHIDALGYGRYSVRKPKNGKPHAGKSVAHLAHRYSYELNIGPIPEGLEPDHLCKVRNCINPFHLELVTHKENVLRGNAPCAINARKTSCIRGHELSPKPNWPGHRYCKICARANSKRRYKAFKELKGGKSN